MDEVVASIVNYNSADLLVRAVDSLLHSKVRPTIEVIDNASTDHSIDLLQDRFGDDPGINITRNNRNEGFARGHNAIMRSREAKFYLLLNPDCMVDPDAVGHLVATMKSRPEVGLAGGMLRDADGNVQKSSKRRFPTPWTGLARTLGVSSHASTNEALRDFDLASERDEDIEYVEAISGAMMFVRADALKKVGLLDEGYFMHCEDLDWCKRFWDNGFKVAYVPAAKAVHVKGGSGRDARVVWHLHRGMIRFFQKHYRDRYSTAFSLLVYVGIYLRAAFLMVPGFFKKRGA